MKKKLPCQSAFYFTRFHDDELAGLFEATKLWCRGAPAMAVEIGSAVHDEIGRRVWNVANTGEAPHGPRALSLHFDQWSDKDLADGLRLSTAMTYSAEHESFGQLADWLASTLVEHAAERLMATNDPRNAIHYIERNFPQEGATDVDTKTE